MLLKSFCKATVTLATAAFLSTSAPAFAEDFSVWKNAYRQKALAQGVSPAVFDSAMRNVAPVQRIRDLDKKQPEKKITFAQYRKNVVTQGRIAQGQRLYRENKALLDQVAAQYGVQPQYIVALWGIETSFGNNTGGYDVVTALATLAWDGRRRDFFETELTNALKILQAGHIDQGHFKGSWAGAMGQCQFMPSSFNAYAQDFNRDGHKDIWTTLPDVFASAANYLHKNGWQNGMRWGREVKLNRPIDASLVSLKISKPLSFWAGQGITTVWGQPLPQENVQASLVQPDGKAGPTYLVYDNYKVIMDWNRSTYFATSVGLLADAIAAAP
ncbi:MAG: lytic transglycosylase domain-containing protein [Pseudobdellovibrionaceae bacterium]